MPGPPGWQARHRGWWSERRGGLVVEVVEKQKIEGDLAVTLSAVVGHVGAPFSSVRVRRSALGTQESGEGGRSTPKSPVAVPADGRPASGSEHDWAAHVLRRWRRRRAWVDRSGPRPITLPTPAGREKGVSGVRESAAGGLSGRAAVGIPGARGHVARWITGLGCRCAVICQDRPLRSPNAYRKDPVSLRGAVAVV